MTSQAGIDPTILGTQLAAALGQFADELVDVVRREIEREELDGHRPIARRVVRAKHRSPRPRTDLMKNTKRSERGRKPSVSSFRAQ